MKFFSSLEKKKKLGMVFDIGSSSLGVAFFWLEKDKAPKIIYTMRESIPLEKELNFENFSNDSMLALNNLVSKACMKGFGKPDEIFCVLSSPWYASQTRVIKFEKTEGFVFDAKLVDNLISKETTLFYEEHLFKYGGNEDKIRAIELKTMKVVLNGYPTLKPNNQKAKNLEMFVFMSMSQEKVLKRIEEIVKKHFHFDQIKFSSFLMASFLVARDMFINQDDFLLVNIGGEVTDISMIKKDIIKDSISFPLGTNFLIRGISQNFNCDIEEAKSLFSLYQDKHMEKSILMKFDPLITKLKDDWLSIFQDSLSHLTNDISIPATVFITIDQHFETFFSKTIHSEQFNQYVLTDSKFKLIFLGTKALHGIATFENESLRDPFLIIESIYINQFLK